MLFTPRAYFHRAASNSFQHFQLSPMTQTHNPALLQRGVKLGSFNSCSNLPSIYKRHLLHIPLAMGGKMLAAITLKKIAVLAVDI